MRINDYGKMVMQALLMVVVMVLALANVIDGDFVKVMMGTILGYLFGNGVNAVRGTAPSPVIAPKDVGD